MRDVFLFRCFQVAVEVNKYCTLRKGNNPMVGATVACAVAVYEGLKG